MLSIRDRDIARNWEPLHDALQQHVRIPLLNDHEDDWNKTVPESLGRSFANNGHISATDSKDVVRWYTLAYSCMHFDALNELMNSNEFKQRLSLQYDSSILHIDFGCGPGTSTWAAIKNLSATIHLETVGHDHNPHMVDLAKSMVQTISQSASNSGTSNFFLNWEEFTDQVMNHAKQRDIFLVTANSLFGQHSFSSSYRDKIINFIRNLRDEAQQALIVLCGTHPPYQLGKVKQDWGRIAKEIQAATTYDQEISVSSWSPTRCTHDIHSSWHPWEKPQPQDARILVLPPAGGKR